ncbi:MAG: transcriptional regulator [Rubritepida sp.]|nr:transcriptional regulator [Rubritepida sp.]
MEGRGVAVSFGPFQLRPAEGALWRDGLPIHLGGRAFAILCTLAESGGQLVSQAQIMDAVWPGLNVDESSPRVHLTALRRALGDDGAGGPVILNVPGRGYRLVLAVRRNDEPQNRRVASRAGLPAAVGRLHGREAVIARIGAAVTRGRLVTLVGVGGIGKTTAAIAAAAALTNGVGEPCFIDLTPLRDGRQLPLLVTGLLGHRPDPDNPLDGLFAALGQNARLLILDNCEHLIGDAALFAEQALRGAPALRILATSREPLRAEAEVVMRLEPLEYPAAEAVLDGATIGAYPAVALFWDRAAPDPELAHLSKQDLSCLAELCRRLDGIPLAIELAAAQLSTFGLEGLAARLDDRFTLLTRGRRTALPRHQTLRATLDWSHDLLPEDERTLLRRLAVFNGGFTPASVHAVAGIPTETLGATEERLGNLLAKSLLVADHSRSEPRFRLLETMRAYAQEKLGAEGGTLAKAHADHFLAALRMRPPDGEAEAAADWLSGCALEIDNLRAALDWAFSPGGDMRLAVALTEAAIPIWYHLSRIPECAERVMAALAWLESAPFDSRRSRMRFHAALGGPMLYARGSGRGAGAATWRVTLALAEELGDRDYQLRALWALWADHINLAEGQAALTMAERVETLAAGGEDHWVGARLAGVALHMLGRQAEARTRFETMLQNYQPPPASAHIMRFQFEQASLTRMMLARVLWVQGLPDSARRLVNAAIAQAQASGHLLTECNVLAQSACAVALLRGDLDEAATLAERLRTHCRAQSYDVWLSYGDCYEAEIAIRRGDLEAGGPRLTQALRRLRMGGYVQYETAHSCTLIAGLTTAGRTAEASEHLDRAMSMTGRDTEMWCVPELHRLRAEIAIKDDPRANIGIAENELRISMEIASSQGALAWQLRSATTLARIQQEGGILGEGQVMLSGLLARINEGFDSADFMDARKVCDVR